MWYGMITGLAFAVMVWGWDGYLLNEAHAFLPWLKLVIGIISAVITGGIIGYLGIRLQNSIIAFILWLVASVIFAWLTVAIPLQFVPFFSRLLNPQLKDLIAIGSANEFTTRVATSFLWNVIFTSIAGILEFPLVDSAVFSFSVAGRFLPFLVCIVIMGIGGNMADELNNKPLRSPIVSLDYVLQFTVDHQGKQVDPKTARDMHLASLRSIQDSITSERQLLIGSYDEVFEQIHVLIKFKSNWADCLMLFEQPISCQPITF